MKTKTSIYKNPSNIFPSGVFELEILYKRTAPKKIAVTKAKDIEEFAKEYCYLNGTDYVEEFYVLFLDRANKIFAFRKFFTGGVSMVAIDIKVIFQAALQCLCSSIVLVHNHPSGNTKPSEADIDLTRKIKITADFHDIHLLDHVIITKESFYSFLDAGVL